MNNAFILYGQYQNPYLRFVRVCDGFVFDRVAATLTAEPTWGDSAVSLGAKNPSINGWPVMIPGLPNGSFDMQLYDSDLPAQTDEMITGWRLIMPHQLVIDPTQFPLDIFGRIRTTNA
jgi:hypothetical protein